MDQQAHDCNNGKDRAVRAGIHGEMNDSGMPSNDAAADKDKAEQVAGAEGVSGNAAQHDDGREDWERQRDAHKLDGDGAFKAGNFIEAIRHYTSALSVDPDNAVLLSNRSAAYLKSDQKSRALHDAQACVRIGTMGKKGISRMAAALQSLGRYTQALEQWEKILTEDPNNQAALAGAKVCKNEVNRQRQEKEAEEAARKKREEEELAKAKEEDGDGDDLDDFFNEVEEAQSTVIQEKVAAAREEEVGKATNAIKNQKKDLGTASEQIERLLQKNHKWLNLNPFYVLDLAHTADKEEVSRRYKALSLLLHPDKNRDSTEKAQFAFDEVKKAKTMLDDEVKANHLRQLAEEGMKQGKTDWERRGAAANGGDRGGNGDQSLEGFQARAVHKIFAQVEQSRRELEQRQRNHEQRERQKEQDEQQKERKARTFDKDWKKEDRVDKRIGNWRDFQKKKKSKT